MRSWVHDVLGVVISSTRRAQSPECVHKALYAIACTKPCMRAQCVFPFEVKRNTWHPKGFQKVFTWLCIQTMTTDMRWIHSVSCPCWIPAIVARFYYTCTAMQGVRIIWCLFICSKCASLHDFLDDETTSNENVLGILLRRCRGISAFQMHFSLMKTQPICDWPGFQSTQIYV